jgi:hypothetical protein
MAWGEASVVAGYTAVGKEEWKGKAMNHIGDGNKMVSDTPRTDCQLDVSRKFGCYQPWIAPSFARQLERELQEANERLKRLEEAGNRMYVLLDPASICMRTTEMDNALQGWDDAKIGGKEAKL